MNDAKYLEMNDESELNMKIFLLLLYVLSCANNFTRRFNVAFLTNVYHCSPTSRNDSTCSTACNGINTSISGTTSQFSKVETEILLYCLQNDFF